MEMTSTTSPLKHMDDYSLVQQALEAGDQRAYALLMERYRDSVFNMMLKMVHNREDADDLVLEAFGKAFRRLEAYTPNFAFSTWLFKIAINNCIDFIRKKKLNLMSIDDSIEADSRQDFSGNLKATSLDPEEKYIQGQRIKLMQTVLCKLSPKYRLMLELRFFEDLSYQEIAHELDIPLGTVKAQLFRAKELMFSLLKESDSDHIL